MENKVQGKLNTQSARSIKKLKSPLIEELHSKFVIREQDIIFLWEDVDLYAQEKEWAWVKQSSQQRVKIRLEILKSMNSRALHKGFVSPLVKIDNASILTESKDPD